jgi:hypothetical protein
MNSIKTSTQQLILVAAIAAAALLSAGSVLAQQVSPADSRALEFHGTAKRADVVAEAVLAASVSGRGELDSPALASAGHGSVFLSRAAVKAETVRAIRAHEVINAGETFSVLPSKFDRVAGNAR